VVVVGAACEDVVAAVPPEHPAVGSATTARRRTSLRIVRSA
jgi:hypothetical protein